jgi:hypothetical protein
VNVKAGGHISITTDSSMDSSSTSNADGGGFVASVDADSVGEMDDATQAVIGSERQRHRPQREPHVRVVASAVRLNADATAGGLFGSASATASGTVHAECC